MPDDLLEEETPEELDPAKKAESDLRALRKKAKLAEELQAKLDGYEKKDVFRDAKVDLHNPVGQLLFETWTGPMTVEAITARAEELNCLESPGAGAETRTGPSDDERRSTEERGNLHAGGEPETGAQTQPDPTATAVKNAQDALAAGRTESDALAAGVRTMFEAAQAGDPRAAWEPRRS